MKPENDLRNFPNELINMPRELLKLYKPAKNPFRFYTSSVLVELTGRKAIHLREFLDELKKSDSSTIFFHIHHAFREHQYAPGDYINDFVYWVSEILEEHVLAEKLANVNIKDFTHLTDLKNQYVEIIKNYLNEITYIPKVAPSRAFYFSRNIGVIYPTKYEVNNLDEFCRTLPKVGLRSLYFHFFDARLRLNRPTNDFSDWIRTGLGLPELAAGIDKINPYLFSMDELRDHLIEIIRGEKKTLVGKVRKWAKSVWPTTKK